MNNYILRQINTEIAKTVYDIALKRIEYDTRRYNNEDLKTQWMNVSSSKKEPMFKRDAYALEIIDIQKKMLEIDLELLELKKQTFVASITLEQEVLVETATHQGSQ